MQRPIFKFTNTSPKKIWTFKFPSETPTELKQLGEQCLDIDKEKRPTSNEILNILEQYSPITITEISN